MLKKRSARGTPQRGGRVQCLLEGSVKEVYYRPEVRQVQGTASPQCKLLTRFSTLYMVVRQGVHQWKLRGKEMFPSALNA